MNALKSRKELLIAESELNRAQLVQECQAMTDTMHALAKQAKTIGLIAASAASLIGILRNLRGNKSAPTIKKPSWLQTILNYAPIAGSLWSGFNARPKN